MKKKADLFACPGCVEHRHGDGEEIPAEFLFNVEQPLQVDIASKRSLELVE